MVLGIQLHISGEDILQKPDPGKEKACKSFGVPGGGGGGGWGWLPVNMIPA